MSTRGFKGSTKNGITMGYYMSSDAYPQQSHLLVETALQTEQTARELNETYEPPHFMLDSLFCEWAYITNWDNKTVDIYKGFQKVVPKYGIFSGDTEKVTKEYFPCDKLISIDFEVVKEIPYQLLEEKIYELAEQIG